MSSMVKVAVHPSQFPGRIRRDLLESLRSRAVHHKFHYDSVKQAQKWLELHRAYSPSQTDPEVLAIYDAGFQAVGNACGALRPVQVVGLGCGGGQKDARLIELLRKTTENIEYVPCDVSSAMVLIAHAVVSPFLPADRCHPLVCDLASTSDLGEALDGLLAGDGERVVSLFGMLPNFEPPVIVSVIRKLLRPGDLLLLSANLAPGTDYRAGVEKIWPLYANALTREWLMLFLLDVGFESSDGGVRFSIETCPEGSGLLRIAAYFDLARDRTIGIGEERFEFRAGESIRLFFSYRHTPDRVRTLFESCGLQLRDQWISRSEEEGVALFDLVV